MNHSNQNSEIGNFLFGDLPAEDQSKPIYFKDYEKEDGQWIEKGEEICSIQIGDGDGVLAKYIHVVAGKSGFLAQKLSKGKLLEEGDVIYELHDKGVYKNENSVDSPVYKHYADLGVYRSLFREFLVEEGVQVQVGDPVYTYFGANYEELTHVAEKEGLISLQKTGDSASFRKNDYLYSIKEIGYKIRNNTCEIRPASTVYILHNAQARNYQLGVTQDASKLQNRNKSIAVIASKEFSLSLVADGIVASFYALYASKKIEEGVYDLSDNDVKDVMDTLL